MIKKQDIIIKILTVLFPNAKIILFGSRARGDFRPGPDIDIAIDDKQEISFQDLAQAKNVIEALNIPYQVDVVDFNDVPPKNERTHTSRWNTMEKLNLQFESMMPI